MMVLEYDRIYILPDDLIDISCMQLEIYKHFKICMDHALSASTISTLSVWSRMRCKTYTLII